MPTVYLDSSILIEFLYKPRDRPERSQEVNRFMAAISESVIQAAISFYVLPELYVFAKKHQPDSEISQVFRLSMVELFNIPIIIFPYLERDELKRQRQQFTIADSDDARHVAVALSKKCDAIITFDHHFRQVADLISVFTPAEYLATLESAA